jgi:methylmalonyl-CoA mutase C-terminal domain/subunit
MNTKGRILLGKTSLDGHWRGPYVVAQALRDGGYEVIVLGAVKPADIVAAAVQEGVDIIGLNVGGHISIVERILDALDEAGVQVPVMAGGTITPPAVRLLNARGVRTFPPGSDLGDIVRTADELVEGTTSQARQ